MKARSFFYRHAGLGSLLATATNAVAIFIIFRLAYRVLGPPVVGLWALIQGIMVISRLGDMGSAGNITRLVSIEYTRHGNISLKNFILAGLLVGTVPILILGGITLVPAFYYTNAHYAHVTSANELFFLIVCSLMFGALLSASSILSGCLDGIGLMALRGYISCAGNILFVPLAYFVICQFGNVGLGIAYVAYALLLTVFFALSVLVLQSNPIRRSSQNSVTDLVKTSFNFSVNFFAIGLCRLLLDPTCKILIGTYSSLGQVAIFDLANKFAGQIIMLFSSAMQSVLPGASRETKEITASQRGNFVAQSKLVTRWAFCAMTILVLFSGHLSVFLLGHISEQYLLLQIILAMGGAINTVGLAGYYLDVGSGHIRRLVVIFAVTAGLNLVLGAALGMMFGAIGVAAGFSIAWAIGGSACSRSLFIDLPSQLRSLLSWGLVDCIVFALASAFVWYVMAEHQHLSFWIQSCAILACSVLVFGTFLYRGGAQFLLQYGGRKRAI